MDVKRGWIVTMAISMAIAIVWTIVWLLRIWAVDLSTGDAQISLFCLPSFGGQPAKCLINFTLTLETQLLALVVLSGALGSFIYMANSFVTYVGNRKLKRSWLTWYFLRPFIGVALALIFYFIMRGGLITTTSIQDGDINPFGVVAIAALVGLFSKQTVDKLKDVFETIFTNKADEGRRDGLKASTDAPPTVSAIVPDSVEYGFEDAVEISGSGFDQSVIVKMNGQEQEVFVESQSKLYATINWVDLDESETLEVVVCKKDLESEPQTIRVISSPDS